MWTDDIGKGLTDDLTSPVLPTMGMTRGKTFTVETRTLILTTTVVLKPLNDVYGTK